MTHASGVRGRWTLRGGGRRVPAFHAARGAQPHRQEMAWRLLVFAAVALGAVALCWDYSLAAGRDTGGSVYALFWVAFLLVLVPCAVRLVLPTTPRPERLVIVALLALANFLPRYLRDPTGPLFHDELLNWRQSEAVHQAALPFRASALPILEYFPGLHLVTDMLHRVAGLPQWTTATLLIAAVHVAVLVGVFLLSEEATGSSRVGAIAALIYSLNPSMMFFHSQYSYESLAILFFVWVLLAMSAIEKSRRPEGARPWLYVGALIGPACVVTHHVTTYSLLLALVACAASATVIMRRRGDLHRTPAAARGRLIWSLPVLVAVGAVAWFALIATASYAYVAYHVDSGVTELFGLIEREAAAHELFQKSTAPSYERIAAVLAPLLMALGAAAGLRRLWIARGAPAFVAGMGSFGLLYFASLPLILSLGGNEGARRSWAFTYLGLAVLIAPAVDGLLRGAWRRGRPLRVGAVAVLVAGACVVEVGNVAAGLNETYRFPGPFVYGSDTRSQTAEAVAAATWFAASQGPGHRIAIDRYLGLTFFSRGHQDTIGTGSSSPIYRLLIEAAPPSIQLLRELRARGYEYLVVDRRSTQAVPREGIYLEPSEPHARQLLTPLAPMAVEKFEPLPWATRIYGSYNLAIYRIDYGALGLRPPAEPREETP